MRHKYIFNVLVPEGIIKCLQEKYNWTWKKANDFFIDADSRITENELREFDEEIEDEIKKETERKRKAIYDSHEDDSDDHGNQQSYRHVPKSHAKTDKKMISSMIKSEIRPLKSIRNIDDSRVDEKFPVGIQPNDTISDENKKNHSYQHESDKRINPTIKTESWKGCIVASPDSTMDPVISPVDKNENHIESSYKKNQKLKRKNEDKGSNVSYCIESSVTTKGNNIIIKMIKIKEESSTMTKKERPRSESSESSSSTFKQKQSSSALYCFCRRTYDGSFMIKCDACKESYHPRCLNVSSKEFTSKINGRKWLCPPCKNKKSIKMEDKNHETCNSLSSKLRRESLTNPFKLNTKNDRLNPRFKTTSLDVKKDVIRNPMKILNHKTPLALEKLGKKPLQITKKTDVYCLCRRENDGTFMIGCDYCDEWYHPYCLKISNEKAFELGRQTWACPKCSIRNQRKK